MKEIEDDELSREPNEIFLSENLDVYHKLDRSLKEPAIFLRLKFTYQNAEQYPSVYYSLAS